MLQKSNAALAAAILGSLNLVLFVAALVIWQGKSLAEARAKKERADHEQTRLALEEATRRLDILKAKVRSGDHDWTTLLAGIDQDIGGHGSGIPNETYTDVVEWLQTLLATTRAELAQLRTDKEIIERNYKTLEAIKQESIREAHTAAAEAQRDLGTERANFLRQLDEKDREIRAMMDRANTLAQRLETEQRDKSRVREELLSQINQLRLVLEKNRSQNTPEALAQQTPDGSVIRSSAATKLVWINIGSRQGAQPQLTFSVYPSDHNGNPDEQPKAKIEIIKIVGQDMSEARVVKHDVARPILQGDLIYNPAWEPGRALHFALMGVLDIDGDGQDDRHVIRQIIRDAGGKIDAELASDGTLTGKVTVQTDYLLRGDDPLVAAGEIKLAQIFDSMAKMQRTALDYGAIVISLPKFLRLMGYDHANRLTAR